MRLAAKRQPGGLRFTFVALAEPSGVELIQQLNDETAAYAELSERGGVLRLRWMFICECGDPHCVASAELTRAEYASLRRSGARVLASGHRVSTSRAPGNDRAERA